MFLAFFWSLLLCFANPYSAIIQKANFKVVSEWKYAATMFKGAVLWSFFSMITLSVIYAPGMENPALCLASVMLLSELLGVRLPDRSAAPAKSTPPIC